MSRKLAILQGHFKKITRKDKIYSHLTTKQTPKLQRFWVNLNVHNVLYMNTKYSFTRTRDKDYVREPVI